VKDFRIEEEERINQRKIPISKSCRFCPRLPYLLVDKEGGAQHSIGVAHKSTDEAWRPPSNHA
jgi:hypothetical protein